MIDEKAPIFDIEAEAGEAVAQYFQLCDDPLPIESIAAVSPIRVTVPYHGKSTNDKVAIGGVFTDDGRESNANGTHTITVIDSNTYTLNGTTTNGASSKGKDPVGEMGTPRDCTGGAVTCKMRRTPADADPAVFTPTIAVISLVNGEYELQISRSDLLTLAGSYERLAYDVIFTDSLGKPTKEFRGTLKISKVVTR